MVYDWPKQCQIMKFQKCGRYLSQCLVQPLSCVIGQAGNLHYEAEDLRQQCVSFLQYIKVFLYR